MAFDTYKFSDVSTSNDGAPFEHDPLDICACVMCQDGGENAFGVDGTYNVQHSNVPSTDLSSTKPSYTYEEAGLQITRWDAKWDDTGLRFGSEEGNAAGSAGYVTYSFLDEDSVSTDTDDRDYRAMTIEEIARTLMAINEFEEVANITFARLQDTGSEYLANEQFSQMDFQAIADYNGGWATPSWTPTGEEGDLAALTSSTVSVGISGLENYGSWSYKTAVHEIGHAVGLPHPGDYNGDGATTYENQAVYAEDTYMYTVMSYWSHTITGGDTFQTVYNDAGESAFIGGYATGLLLHDIAALHRLYGANMETRAGDTVYGFNSTEAVESHWNLDSWQDFFVAAIWDAGGVDTIDASGYYEDQVISLVEEDFSSLGGLTFNLSIAKGVIIENAIGGAGDDVLIGNSADNILDGGAGVDIVDYSVLTEGINFDVSTGTVSGAQIGTDTLISIEGIIATNFDDVLIGDDGDNFFIMLDGDDTITGGEGVDWISLRGATVGVEITAETLAIGVIAYDGIGTNTFTGIEGIEGTAFSDSFSGDDATQYYSGGAGDDLFVASLGGDTYDGGDGNDELDLRASTTGVSISLLADEVVNGGDFGALTISNFENVLLTNSNDWVNATSGANVIFAYGGDDTIYAQQGDDTVYGGGGDDYIGGWYGNDALYGGDGNDTIEGQFNNDVLRGQDGDDTLDGGDGSDRLQGDDGNDTLLGGAGNDTAFGGNGNDILNGGSGIDRLTGNDGDDVFDGGADNDRIIGGAGIDTGTGGDGVDNLSGGADDDVLYGGMGNDRVQGDDGNDTLYGEEGDDRIVGGLGDDIMFGGIGNDLLIGQNGDDTFDGGDGDDIMQGGAGVNTFNAGAGHDRAVGGLEVDTMLGGDGNDLLIGNGGDDIIDGEDGDDRLEGDNGNDLLNGGLGNDLIYGGAGVDTINGGDGVDTILGGGGSDLINGDAGNDILRGEDGNDTINGGDGDDDIRGQAGFDTLNGGDGDDRIQGDDGNDTIDGGAGADTIFGGNGNDTITGGAGADILRGNAGSDTFVFAAGDSLVGEADTINDFASDDTIEIAGHTFVDTNAFSGSGSFEVRYESSAAGTFIEMDRDGDGTADERIDFDGVSVWTFVSDGTDITGVVNGPEDGSFMVGLA